VSQSERFLAEEILRQAASGAIPSDGDLLVRGPNGWFFGRVGDPSPQPPNVTPPAAGAPGAGAPPGGGGGSITFADIIGVAFARQIVESSVTQHEGALEIGANQVFGGFFGAVTAFPDLVYTFANQMRRALRTITAADTPYTAVDGDWHINVNISLGSVDVQLPTAISRAIPGFTDQLHIKKIGEGEGTVTLIPAPGELIDDSTSAIIRARNRCFTLVSDSQSWWIQ